jgi:hypothetical protein
MKKQVKANTRRKKESAERRNAETKKRNANAKRRRNAANANAAARRRIEIDVRPESPAFEFGSDSEEEKAPAAPPSKMPTGKFWAKPEFKNPPI